MIRAAHITECGLFRTWLTRRWEEWPKRALIMHGLNPSKADAEIDDPTIRRDISFAKREGCGMLMKTNLYEFRATEPKDMFAAAERRAPDYWQRMGDLLAMAPCPVVVVACWGVNAKQADADEFCAWAQDNSIPLWCLGKTISGAPRHPLYVKGDQPLERFA